MRPFHKLACLAALALLSPAAAPAQTASPPPRVTAPEAFFEQPPGTDYFLADYTAYEAYLKRLASESDRMKLVDIGRTAEGRTQWMAIVSSPANLARLDHYKDIAERLARARLNDEQARALASEGKAVVWIDAGMHATETVPSQGQIQVLYRMLTQTDPETMRILNDTIALFAHDNPDGMELVSDWYMRHSDPKKREFATIPRLYQKYVGHDNNRDSFTVHMPETENINRVLFREWYPQIVYNQHQTGPEGMVVFVPPFRDPFNFNYDPLVMSELSEVGAAMHSRLIAEGKGGSGMRSAAPYSTWHNGMERSVAYFHNSIGLLTEIIGGPTPTKIPLVPSTQLPRGDEPLPIAPQEWRLQQSIDYQLSLNRAVLDYASRNRERLLFNIYRMGANSIARGSRDNWTVTPKAVARLEAAPRLEGGGARKVDPALYDKILQAPENRDARGYVITADQKDFPTAVAFVNSLIKNGVEVERATSAFSVAGKTYPAGSFVVKAAQAYRPHILDMFEPQDHPNDVEFPGGPPKAPYDVAGYTLAYQMGIKFDRILEGFDGPFQRVADVVTPPPGRIEGRGGAGWIVGHESNNSFILTNRLLKAGIRPSWLTAATDVGGKRLQPGAIWIPASGKAAAIVANGVRDLGISAHAVARQPAGPAMPLKLVRIGLVDRYGGLMSSGWTRWILERFEFPFQLVYPQRLDAGNLKRDFDVLVFTDGAVPVPEGGPWRGDRPGAQPARADTPPEFQPMLGNITEAKTAPAVEAFAREGGTVVAIGSSTRLATLLNAPVTPALAENRDGTLRALDTKTFFIPGSILRARVDNRQPLAYGLPDEVDIFFARSQTFLPVAGAPEVKRISWFDGRDLLRSGWAVGQEKLSGTIAVADIDIGRGKLFLMGPEVTQRAQSFGTFKFLFNALLYGPAQAGQPRTSGR
ncbi:MAG TPA: M14 metallopeptidase family protein [Allosphingosinicella sp.]|nr:M14 metallopeptidase family protein [Allosphingosinicella sp.]